MKDSPFLPAESMERIGGAETFPGPARHGGWTLGFPGRKGRGCRRTDPRPMKAVARLARPLSGLVSGRQAVEQDHGQFLGIGRTELIMLHHEQEMEWAIHRIQHQFNVKIRWNVARILEFL